MEEKKSLTAEERIELKERLKKQIDELSDEELDRIAGGYETWRPGVIGNYKRYRFTEEEAAKLQSLGFNIEPNQEYRYDKLQDIFHTSTMWTGNNLLDHEKDFEGWLEYCFKFKKS